MYTTEELSIHGAMYKNIEEICGKEKNELDHRMSEGKKLLHHFGKSKNPGSMGSYIKELIVDHRKDCNVMKCDFADQ